MTQPKDEPFDLMKIWADFEAEVAAAPLLTKDAIARQALALLEEHGSMIDIALAEIEKQNENEEPVREGIRQIRQQLHRLTVLTYKRSGVPLFTRRLRIVP